jgi:glucose/arabinose dehydrogenase
MTDATRSTPSYRWLFRLGFVVVVLAIAGAIVASRTATVTYAPLPEGFEDVRVLGGLQAPVSFALAPDGRVFVGEQSGRIIVFDSLSDQTGSLFADLSTEVHSYSERGLMDIAVDPQFPRRPYVYALYTLDARIGEQPPLWGTPGKLSDPCPGPEGGTVDGCIGSGRLSRLTAVGNKGTDERVLIEDWCVQFNTHTVGSMAFAPDGSLYVSAGDGGDWRKTDYGQFGKPVNPCGDPPGGVGQAAGPDLAEGGSLRAQSPLRKPGSPITLDGTVIRVDPDTGKALPDNPWASSRDANLRRIVAFGLKNPFRMTLDPSGKELWIGDVGHITWEEVDRLSVPVRKPVNFGWPCYEGRGRQTAYNPVNDLNPEGFQIATTGRCQALYDQGDDSVEPPYFAYRHYLTVTPADGCPYAGTAISGLARYQGDRYPEEYRGALFFADFSRGCIWAMLAGDDGMPDPTHKMRFRWNAAAADLTIGPGGDLFYVDLIHGELRRIVYRGSS